MIMKNPYPIRSNPVVYGVLCVALLLAPFARAGLTLQIHLYRSSQGSGYAFYTPLSTNAIAPAAAFGTYIVRSPGWPTNGSQRAFDLSATGLSDHYELDGEYGYGDFNSALFQITNGVWSIEVTNATSTNVFDFTVSAPAASSNMLPATVITFPMDQSVILSSDTNFTWQAPSGWSAGVIAQTYNYDNYYQYAGLPPGQTNWDVDSSLPAHTNFTFTLQYLTTNDLFSATEPLNTNNAQPISGWAVMTILETGSSVGFDVAASRAVPGSGHTCFAYYSFEDNNLFAHDFSGNGNDLSYSWYSGSGMPPVIVTNDAAAGTYASGFAGSGWFNAPDALNSVFSGSFSVSLWLKTTNIYATTTADEYSAAGIVSALGNDYGTGVLPMGQAGDKLVFYTGGSLLNLLYSHASINGGQYVHVVVTRDQQTGEKRIYINGALDANVFSDTDLLEAPDSGGPVIGYNNGNVFVGQMDEIQFYSGVLSSNEVAFLHSHPASKVADTVELSVPVGRYDFEDTNSPGADSSGHHNDAYYESGSPADIASTNAPVGSYARQFFGGTSYLFPSGSAAFPNLSNALTGSFSVTAWVNTTNSVDQDDANAYFGSPILFLYNSTTNSTIPLSITGSKAAFTIYDENGNAVTLHSTTTVNDGNYHCLAVTRDLPSGQMNLYVDGNLEATGTSSKQFLQIPWIHLAGGYVVPYTGLLDDVRIYGGVLSPDDVAALAQSGATLNGALGTTGLTWTTTGDANWFVETTNTYDGEPSAAQSGSVTGNQISTLSVTVTGPGTLTFAWSSIADDPNQQFDYEFDLDGSYMDDIYGDTSWTQDGQFTIPAGPHTLSWTVSANGDTDPAEAGFLDQVNYISTLPSLTVTAGPASGQAPLTVQFVSPSVDSAGNPVTSWNWSFGDGGTSTAQSPLYIYATPGSFTPSLAAYSTFGATPLSIKGLGVISVTNGIPIITRNPFSQTNYPGYNVALLAGANAPVSWQWFQPDSATPIPGATNALFIPTNSGTAGVAGSYYAVASNNLGSANTATAAVTFASAPLPPNWSVAFASPLENAASDVTTNYNIACAVDATGNVYSVGSVNGTNMFGSNSLISIDGNSGASILKQTPTGVPLWGRCITNNGGGSSYAQCAALAPGNGCYVSGGFFGTNWLGTNLLVDTAGGSTFLACFDAAGNNLWVRTITGTNGNFTEYHRLASDPDGNVTLSTLASGTTSFGGTNVAAIAGQKGLLVQYDAGGNVRWWQVPSGWPSFLVSQNGRIYGSMGGNGSLGGTSLNFIGGVTNVSDRGQAVFALNAANGQAFWVLGVGGQAGVGNPGGLSDQDPVLAVSGTNFFVAGTAWGSNAVCGPFSVAFPAAKGQYFARYDTNGNAWAAAPFGSPFTWPWAMAVDAGGNVYVGGDFDTYSFFGSDIIAAPFFDTVQSVGSIDDRIPGQGFIAKFDANGKPLWARPAQSLSSYLNCRDIAVVSDGVWGCGFFNQVASFGTIDIAGGITINGFPFGTITYHPDGFLAKITQVVSAQPVMMINPQAGPGNFQFGFLSQSPFTNSVQYRTNLVVGTGWQTCSNVVGDGTLKTVAIPLSTFGPAQQVFFRVLTQ